MIRYENYDTGWGDIPPAAGGFSPPLWQSTHSSLVINPQATRHRAISSLAPRDRYRPPESCSVLISSSPPSSLPSSSLPSRGSHLLSSLMPLTALIEASTLFPSSFQSSPLASSLPSSSPPFRFSPPFLDTTSTFGFSTTMPTVDFSHGRAPRAFQSRPAHLLALPQPHTWGSGSAVLP